MFVLSGVTAVLSLQIYLPLLLLPHLIWLGLVILYITHATNKGSIDDRKVRGKKGRDNYQAYRPYLYTIFVMCYIVFLLFFSPVHHIYIYISCYILCYMMCFSFFFSLSFSTYIISDRPLRFIQWNIERGYKLDKVTHIYIYIYIYTHRLRMRISLLFLSFLILLLHI